MVSMMRAMRSLYRWLYWEEVYTMKVVCEDEGVCGECVV